MKIFTLKNLSLVVCTLLAASTLYFFDHLKNIGLIIDYFDTYDPEHISENFRSMYQRYPSARIENNGKTIKLPNALRDFPFPEQYEFLNEQRVSREFVSASHTTGLAVLHNGELIYEFYDRGNRRDSYSIQMSVGKVYTSFLIGKLLEEGYINSIEDSVDTYVLELRGTAFEGVTIRQLLDMTAGIRWVEDISDLTSELVRSTYASMTDTMDEFVKTIVREREPGTYHHYATVNHYVLGLLIRDASGMSYNDYFQQKMWSKIGAESHAWLQGPPGGVANMPYIRLRDMLRFGYVYANSGKNMAQEQIIDPEWIAYSSAPDHPMLEPGSDNPLSSSYHGYKNQWWFPLNYDQEFAALGIFGQILYVNKKHNVVIAKTSSYEHESEDGGWRRMEAVILFQQTARWLHEQHSLETKIQTAP
ncbi:MAG: serine hydrolase [Pseudomonadota bacterium]